MPKGLIFRIFVMALAAIAAHFYFRPEAAAPAATEHASPAPERAAPTNLESPLAADATTPPLPARPRLGPCDVTHVADGDTLNVRCAGKKERVRMLQVDTPERDDALYDEAGHALTALIAQRRVELELGPEQRDDYGRLLAYVFADGENLNLAMIRDGWSPYFDRYGPGAYPREFAAAERAARDARRGIWANTR
jgi:micrococcal nuclease